MRHLTIREVDSFANLTLTFIPEGFYKVEKKETRRMRGGLCEGVDADVVTFLHVGLLDCWVVGWLGCWTVVSVELFGNSRNILFLVE